MKKKSETIRPALTSSPWYILKAETIGVEGCPLHKEQEGAKGNKLGKDKKVVFQISMYSCIQKYPFSKAVQLANL